MTTFHDLFKPAADDFQVGDGVTVLHWTDRTAFTVIARTATTMTLRMDTARFDRDGNFECEPNPNGAVRTARLTTRRGVTGWRCGGEKCVKGRDPYRDPGF